MNTFERSQLSRPTSPYYSGWRQGRHLTRRGVLWLGLKCDVRCKFCYDENIMTADKAWVNCDKLKRTLWEFRHRFENDFVDFMGGEPTLHPQVLEIIRYSRDLGLLPTCVTHGLHLSDADTVRRFKDAGVHDFLISVHAVDDTLDAIHGKPGQGHAERQLTALRHIRAAGIPLRFNVTMIKDNIDQLPDIARLCGEVGGSVINYLTYNPYFEWRTRQIIPFQVRHSDIVPRLKEALNVCNEVGIEANVRYMPICLMAGYEQHVYTGFQLPYDVHEWDYNSWYGCTYRREGKEWYAEAAKRQRERHSYVHPSSCDTCSLKMVCDGLHRQYYERWSDDELRPYEGKCVREPTVFIDRQYKIEYATPMRELSSDTSNGRQELELTQFSATNHNRAGTRNECNL